MKRGMCVVCALLLRAVAVGAAEDEDLVGIIIEKAREREAFFCSAADIRISGELSSSANAAPGHRQTARLVREGGREIFTMGYGDSLEGDNWSTAWSYDGQRFTTVEKSQRRAVINRRTYPGLLSYYPLYQETVSVTHLYGETISELLGHTFGDSWGTDARTGKRVLMRKLNKLAGIESVDGHRCIVVDHELSIQREGDVAEVSTRRIYFAEDLNYTPVRMEYFTVAGEMKSTRMVFTMRDFKEVEKGIFAPGAGRHEGSDGFVTKLEYEFSRPGPLPDDFFNLTIPAGITVRDETAGIEYIVPSTDAAVESLAEVEERIVERPPEAGAPDAAALPPAPPVDMTPAVPVREETQGQDATWVIVALAVFSCVLLAAALARKRLRKG